MEPLNLKLETGGWIKTSDPGNRRFLIYHKPKNAGTFEVEFTPGAGDYPLHKTVVKRGPTVPEPVTLTHSEAAAILTEIIQHLKAHNHTAYISEV